jgi:hypothetical protein
MSARVPSVAQPIWRPASELNGAVPRQQGRGQIARVLVRSLTSQAALRKTFELVAEPGPEQVDLEPLFAALDADAIGSLDATHDAANMAMEREPQLWKGNRNRSSGIWNDTAPRLSRAVRWRLTSARPARATEAQLMMK